MTEIKSTVHSAYIAAQLARALDSAEKHPDHAVRARSAEKVRKWQDVCEGIGSLGFGSRTPVANVPPWATLEVAQGGFATGRLLAGGALEAHEIELLKRLDTTGVPTERAALNLYYLGDDGREEITAMIRSGCYRVHVPEEGAIPTIVWLLANGATDEARAILEAIAPFFDRLRFYPVPDSKPLVSAATVRLQPLEKTIRDLHAIKQQRRVVVMNEAITVWAPLYDRAVALFLETVEGAVPTLRVDERATRSGLDERARSPELVRGPDGQPIVDGGSPCRVFPAGWTDRARALLGDYDRARARHSMSGKPERKREGFARLRAFLKVAIEDPGALTEGNIARIRRILACFVTRYGAPGTERHAKLRAEQQEIASRPTHGELRSLVLGRLAALGAEDRLQSLDVALAPVSKNESERLRLREGVEFPESIARKLRRSLEGSVEDLVRGGVIRSAEVLGTVLPQMTAQIRASTLADPDLRRLYGAVYAAFRRRRSLLLLNLEHQVKLDELPWIAAMNGFRQGHLSAQEASRETLRQVSLLAIGSYPETIVPNKLLQELRALAEGAQVKLPLVDELAADIFTGAFSEKFLRAAQDAAGRLRGTLYERYYGVPFDRVLRIDDVTKTRHAAPISTAFGELCSHLAGTEPGRSWSVALNGTVIEQEQILTTHNLATLVAVLGVESDLRGRLGELTRRCFRWVCRQQQVKRTPWKSQLRMVKNTAYSWRQMIFFLSLEEASIAAFLAWAEQHFASQTAAFQARFAPALRGLRFVAHGGRFDENGLSPDGGRRFLGWTTSRHWVFGREDEIVARQ